jgi:hypothetical protein
MPRVLVLHSELMVNPGPQVARIATELGDRVGAASRSGSSAASVIHPALADRSRVDAPGLPQAASLWLEIEALAHDPADGTWPCPDPLPGELAACGRALAETLRQGQQARGVAERAVAAASASDLAARAAEHRADSVQSTLDGVLGSASWRITGPLRTFRQRVVGPRR